MRPIPPQHQCIHEEDFGSIKTDIKNFIAYMKEKDEKRDKEIADVKAEEKLNSEFRIKGNMIIGGVAVFCSFLGAAFVMFIGKIIDYFQRKGGI